MRMQWLLLLALAVGACAADTSGDGFDKTGVAPIADPEMAAQVDQDSPSFKAWLDAQYGATKLGDAKVGAKLEKVIGNVGCDLNNNVGAVSTSTPLGAGVARCAAAMNVQGYYACSGNFSSGLCSLAYGIGPSTYSVSSCGSHIETVPWISTSGTVAAINRCNATLATSTGYVYAGLRDNIQNTPAYVYKVPSNRWTAKVDFWDVNDGVIWYGY